MNDDTFVRTKCENIFKALNLVCTQYMTPVVVNTSSFVLVVSTPDVAAGEVVVRAHPSSQLENS